MRSFGAPNLVSPSTRSALVTAAAVDAGSATGRAQALSNALATLNSMRGILATTHSQLMDYLLVLSNDGPAGVDTINHTITYSQIPVWRPAWELVSAAAAPSTPKIAADGQTPREALRLLDQILLYWGPQKLAELQRAADAEAAAARETVAAAQQAAASEAEKQRLAAEAQAAADQAAADALAQLEAAARAEANKKRNTWIAIGVGAVVLLGVGIVIARRK